MRARVEEDMGRPGLSAGKVLATVVRLMETDVDPGGECGVCAGERVVWADDDARKACGGEGVDGDVSSSRGRAGSCTRWALKIGGWRGLCGGARTCRGMSCLSLWMKRGSRAGRSTAADVNDYLRDDERRRFTAKDFRTWSGTVLASLAKLREFEGGRVGDAGEEECGGGD